MVWNSFNAAFIVSNLTAFYILENTCAILAAMNQTKYERLFFFIIAEYMIICVQLMATTQIIGVVTRAFV